MEDLAKYLSHLRASRGITYEQIWEDMRLVTEKIRLIEEGKFLELGEFGMRKAMLYNYAIYLEADMKAVKAELDRLFPASAAPPPVVLLHPKEKRIMLSTNFLWTVAIVIIVAVLGSILYYAYQSGALKAPELFEKAEHDSLKTRVEVVQEEPASPDSGRTRMRELTQKMQPDPSNKEESGAQKQVASDNTDYMGKFLGANPMNVRIR